MIIVVPIEEDKGIKSSLSQHFGRAPFFGVINIQENGKYTFEIKPNESQHFGGFGLPSENILKYKPDAIMTYGMGPRAIQIFNSNKVKVLKPSSSILEENIQDYLKGSIKELNEPCPDAHHKH